MLTGHWGGEGADPAPRRRDLRSVLQTHTLPSSEVPCREHRAGSGRSSRSAANKTLSHGDRLHPLPELRGRCRAGPSSQTGNFRLREQAERGSDPAGLRVLRECALCSRSHPHRTLPLPPLPCPALRPRRPRRPRSEQRRTIMILTAWRRNGSLFNDEAFNILITDNCDTAEEHSRGHGEL